MIEMYFELMAKVILIGTGILSVAFLFVWIANGSQPTVFGNSPGGPVLKFYLKTMSISVAVMTVSLFLAWVFHKVVNFGR